MPPETSRVRVLGRKRAWLAAIAIPQTRGSLAWKLPSAPGAVRKRWWVQAVSRARSGSASVPTRVSMRSASWTVEGSKPAGSPATRTTPFTSIQPWTKRMPVARARCSRAVSALQRGSSTPSNSAPVSGSVTFPSRFVTPDAGSPPSRARIRIPGTGRPSARSTTRKETEAGSERARLRGTGGSDGRGRGWARSGASRETSPEGEGTRTVGSPVLCLSTSSPAATPAARRTRREPRGLSNAAPRPFPGSSRACAGGASSRAQVASLLAWERSRSDSISARVASVTSPVG